MAERKTSFTDIDSLADLRTRLRSPRGRGVPPLCPAGEVRRVAPMEREAPAAVCRRASVPLGPPPEVRQDEAGAPSHCPGNAGDRTDAPDVPERRRTSAPLHRKGERRPSPMTHSVARDIAQRRCSIATVGHEAPIEGLAPLTSSNRVVSQCQRSRSCVRVRVPVFSW